MPTKFRPVTPKGCDWKTRVGQHRCLYADVGTVRDVPPEERGWGHGLYLDRGWYKVLRYVEFQINGQRFTRRATEEASGNFSVTWVVVGGETYQLHDLPY